MRKLFILPKCIIIKSVIFAEDFAWNFQKNKNYILTFSKKSLRLLWRILLYVAYLFIESLNAYTKKGFFINHSFFDGKCDRKNDRKFSVILPWFTIKTLQHLFFMTMEISKKGSEN